MEGLRVGDWQVALNSKGVGDFVNLVSHEILGSLLDTRRFFLFMEVFRCYSDLHLEYFQHPIYRVSDPAKFICECITIYLARIPPLNPEEIIEFETCLFRYIRQVNCDSGVRTPLHSACRTQYPIALLRLLLRVAADPTAADEDGRSPLHFLFDSDFELEICANVQLRLDAGAQMDQVDCDGRTVLDSCKYRMNLAIRPNPDETYLNSIVNDVLPFSLASFCAQVISQYKIPFKNAFPPNLKTYVKQLGGKM